MRFRRRPSAVDVAGNQLAAWAVDQAAHRQATREPDPYLWRPDMAMWIVNSMATVIYHAPADELPRKLAAVETQ